jgi:hypothetical protein
MTHLDRGAPFGCTKARSGGTRESPVDANCSQHAESLEDKHRDHALCALGYRAIRIWNNDVIENPDGILQRLLSELEKSPVTPTLSPQAGRGS